MYAVAIRNVGRFPGQVINIYDKNGNKIGSIPVGKELVVGKGTFYLELPGTYLLIGPLAIKNGFLKITLS